MADVVYNPPSGTRTELFQKLLRNNPYMETARIVRVTRRRNGKELEWLWQSADGTVEVMTNLLLANPTKGKWADWWMRHFSVYPWVTIKPDDIEALLVIATVEIAEEPTVELNDLLYSFAVTRLDSGGNGDKQLVPYAVVADIREASKALRQTRLDSVRCVRLGDSLLVSLQVLHKYLRNEIAITRPELIAILSDTGWTQERNEKARWWQKIGYYNDVLDDPDD